MHDDAYTLLTRLLGQIAPNVDLAGIDRSELLQDAANLDSVDFVNLVAGLYRETGIDVPERDYPRLASVEGFTDYVGPRLAAGADPKDA